MCKKCLYTGFLWSVFPRCWTKYGDLLCECPYSVEMRENTDHNKSECRHFLSTDLPLNGITKFEALCII